MPSRQERCIHQLKHIFDDLKPRGSTRLRWALDILLAVAFGFWVEEALLRDCTLSMAECAECSLSRRGNILSSRPRVTTLRKKTLGLRFALPWLRVRFKVARIQSSNLHFQFSSWKVTVDEFQFLHALWIPRSASPSLKGRPLLSRLLCSHYQHQHIDIYRVSERHSETKRHFVIWSDSVDFGQLSRWKPEGVQTWRRVGLHNQEALLPRFASSMAKCHTSRLRPLEFNLEFGGTDQDEGP